MGRCVAHEGRPREGFLCTWRCTGRCQLCRACRGSTGRSGQPGLVRVLLPPSHHQHTHTPRLPSCNRGERFGVSAPPRGRLPPSRCLLWLWGGNTTGLAESGRRRALSRRSILLCPSAAGHPLSPWFIRLPRLLCSIPGKGSAARGAQPRFWTSLHWIRAALTQELFGLCKQFQWG